MLSQAAKAHDLQLQMRIGQGAEKNEMMSGATFDSALSYRMPLWSIETLEIGPTTTYIHHQQNSRVEQESRKLYQFSTDALVFGVFLEDSDPIFASLHYDVSLSAGPLIGRATRYENDPTRYQKTIIDDIKGSRSEMQIGLSRYLTDQVQVRGFFVMAKQNYDFSATNYLSESEKIEEEAGFALTESIPTADNIEPMLSQSNILTSVGFSLGIRF